MWRKRPNSAGFTLIWRKEKRLVYWSPGYMITGEVKLQHLIIFDFEEK